MEAMNRDQAATDSSVAKIDDKKKQDKRNLALKREGLLNYEDWVHKQPRPTEKMIATRQRLLDEKEKALSKSTNLFVSRKRIQIRGLPRRDFFEGELKELMMVVIGEWIKTKDPNADTSLTTKSQKKKYLKQVKILRDENKVDQDGEKLPSGLGFAEFEDEALALFAIRYLNNMELTANKGLIADYSLEDARVIHKREQRFERIKKVNLDKKREAKKDSKADPKAKTPALPAVVELGKKSTGTNEEKTISIDKITDQEVLHRMLRESISRGKRQRIKKRLAFLRGDKKEAPAATTPSVTTVKPSAGKEAGPSKAKLAPADKVQSLLKKRDAKLKQKREEKKATHGLTQEDKAIMKKVKGHKKETKRQRARETDEFDELMAKYKSKIMKNIGKQGGTNAGHAFEEVELSD